MILAIDQGTTGTTCLVFDGSLNLLARSYSEFEQYFPQPGWVEHDAGEIWSVTRRVALEALEAAGVGSGELKAVGISNQRETVCVWDPTTGEPLHRALVWQDRRTAERCDELRAEGVEPMVRERTGLMLDPYFSATKVEWLLANVDGLADRVKRGAAVFGTVDSWLAWNLTGEHVTDPSNASRTLCYDLRERGWSAELCELMGVPIGALPEIRPSIGGFGPLLEDALPGHGGALLAGIAGDQQAALYGQAAFQPGEGKNTYGTGSFVLVNAGTELPATQAGLLSTVAWGIGEKIVYALEASIFVTGAAVQWLRDGLGIIDDAAETEALAASLADNGGVYFVPALTGLGSPYWDPYARGTIVGLTRGSGRAEMARAALEAIAYQSVDAVRAIESATGKSIAMLKADGGATANGWLMQFQADVLGVPVVVPEIAETTALGAAMMAAVGAALMTESDAGDLWREGRRYEPAMASDERERLLGDWARAVERSRAWEVA
ncbi:MAG: glycerol kinase GlpK [Actinobacteria bacterium]|uniref:glycerol kinase n=1 Tax=freshwater metagenome TaxID=449393 RepID=A0A6J5ZX89_9ZZZZ|nr:glycerol kinase GlpK [Actinomycetota bacterium]